VLDRQSGDEHERDGPQLESGVDQAQGREHEDRRGERHPPERARQRHRGAQPGRAEQEQRHTARQQQRRREVQRRRRVPDGVLDTGGEHQDAQQHRHERVRESLEDLPDALHRVGGGGERVLGAGQLVHEQGPPHARGDDEPEQCRDEQVGVDVQATRAHGDRHDRLAEGDQDHQAVAFDDVRWVQGQAALAVPDRHGPDDDRGEPPHEVAPGFDGHELGGEDRRDRGEVGDEDRAEGAGGLEVHEAVDEDDDEHPDREPDAALFEGLGDAEADDEPAGHGAQDEDAAGGPLGRDDVGEPRVSGEHPPDESEHEHGLDEAQERVVGDEPGELGDDEDEDEVEEQLERRDAEVFVVLGRFDAFGEPAGEDACHEH
jgi:hypothetical protein